MLKLWKDVIVQVCRKTYFLKFNGISQVVSVYLLVTFLNYTYSIVSFYIVFTILHGFSSFTFSGGGLQYNLMDKNEYNRHIILDSKNKDFL